MVKEKTELKVLTANDVGNLLKDGDISVRAGKAMIITKRKVRGKEVEQITYVPLAPVVGEVVMADIVDEGQPAPKRRGRPSKKRSVDKNAAPKRRRGRPPKPRTDEEDADTASDDAPKRRRGRPKKTEDDAAPKRRRGRPPKKVPKSDPEPEFEDNEEADVDGTQDEANTSAFPWEDDSFDDDEFDID